MGLRTFRVSNSSGRVPAASAEELYNNNIDIGGVVSFPDGEYAPNSRGLYPRPSEVPESSFPQDEMDIVAEYGDETIGNINSIPGLTPAGPQLPDAVDPFQVDYPEDPEKTNMARNLRLGAAAIDTIGGVVNAYSRNANFVSANNYKIMQANLQQNYIRGDAARAMLREGTKAQDRKGQAQLNAVAQGQDANGDLARTAMSNEDVYAAQNAMNIEINAMRAIYGLQSEVIAMQTNNRLSRINRNTTIAQSLIRGASQAAIAGA